MKVLIIEDEPRAANRLEKLIAEVSDDMEVIAKLESVRDVVEFLSNFKDIELIFADVQLADGLSFDIFKNIKINCPIIFTTAYDQYAIEAFNMNGIDYLLKPIEENRLKQAVEKLHNLQSKVDLDKLISIARSYPSDSMRYKSRFVIRVGDNIKSIPTNDIKAFYSHQKATFLFTNNNRNYVTDYSIEKLAEVLDPRIFFRINRKYLLSIDACNRIYQWSNTRLKIEVDGLKDHEIIVARDRVKDFKDWLGE